MIKTVFIFGLLGLGALLLFRFASMGLILGWKGTELMLGGIALFFFLLGVLIRYRGKARVKNTTAPSPDTPSGLGLTQREQEVWKGICQGLSNREIAEKLYVSEHTIKTHASNLMAKLDVRRRTQAIAKAREMGLM